MNTITSLEELVAKLNAVEDPDGYLEVLQDIDIEWEELDKYTTWKNDHYTRNCISRTDDYELLLVCWEAGQESKVQDYDKNSAWIHPVKGRLREERFVKSKHGNGLLRISSVLIGTSEFSCVKHSGVHKYTNESGERAASLHLYVKPITHRTIYECDNEGYCTTFQEDVYYDSKCEITCD